MLDGINVLNTIELTGDVFNPISIISFIGVIVAIIVIFIGGLNDYLIMYGIGLIFLILFMSIASYTYMVTKEVPIGEYEYQVTIDKSVSMVDFTSKYDIIRVDGEIYTIREKESE